MTNLLTLFFGASVILCSIYQLFNGLKARNTFSLSLSSSILVLIISKAITLYWKVDLGSNQQFLILFPMGILCVIKTFRDIELHPNLARLLLSFFFIATSFQLPNIKKTEGIEELLREKSTLVREDPQTLNIFFSPQSPFYEEVALVYGLRASFNNTLIFTIPILSSQYEKIRTFKDKFKNVNIISLDVGEEKVAAEVLEVFLARDFKFSTVDYKRFELKKSPFHLAKGLPLKTSIYTKK